MGPRRMHAALERPDIRQYLTACHELFKFLLALQGASTYALWWLERRFPEQFGRREQLEHGGKVAVQATQTKERKLTIELVNSDGEVHRLTRDDVMTATAAVTVETEPKPEPAP